MLTKEVNDLVEKDLSEYQSIFVFVLTHGSYDRIGDVEHKNIEIQSLRKSLIDCDFLLDKPKVLVIEQCQTFKGHSFNHVPNGKENLLNEILAFYRISYFFPKDLTPIRNGRDFLEIRTASPGQESYSSVDRKHLSQSIIAMENDFSNM